MNSAVILKVEWKKATDQNFVALDIIPHSGSLSESFEETPAGRVFNLSCGFKIANSNASTDNRLDEIRGHNIVFKITDANDVVYTIDAPLHPCRFFYARRLDGTPGSFNGYDCSITRKATAACMAQ